MEPQSSKTGVFIRGRDPACSLSLSSHVPGDRPREGTVRKLQSKSQKESFHQKPNLQTLSLILPVSKAARK